MKLKYIFITITIIILVWFALCLPNPLFSDPKSTIIESSDGHLLSARIADDGQWRFPAEKNLPPKFIESITHFEDEYFFYHPGINPVSLFRAIKQNISAGKVISGASTISMQTIRLSRKGQKRTILEKLKEMILAIRLEISYSKSEVLSLYASHAPFGGNVVGLEAASWRYYGRKPHLLSWGEMTALAVLPNAPSLVYPGKNHEKLKTKRNRLLDKLNRKGIIDKETCTLSKEEPLPGTPKIIPRLSAHLLERAIKEGNKGNKIQSSIDYSLQKTLNRIIDNYCQVYKENEIYNAAAIVLDVETAQVIAYIGNSNSKSLENGNDVDIIASPRSTGSILKPFLYTFMLQDGKLMPQQLVPDIPTQISGYSPRNFDETFDGAVPANEALARSLNIPAVRMLQDYGIDQFYNQIEKLQLSHINKSAAHYGLSIILGGAEATLWDLSNEYLKMARRLNDQDIPKKATYLLSDNLIEMTNSPFETGALWWTAEALSTVNRPWQEKGWNGFESSEKIAWKTGTSFGHRDAWAIGITQKYVVGVWVGNADGEGRPGLTGLSSAAPILFKIFKHLPQSEWFQKPDWDLVDAEVCVKSGYLASDICDSTKIIQVPKNALNTQSCPYHHLIHLDEAERFQVNSNCYSVTKMKTLPWFSLPPVQEWYYKKKNPIYKSLPHFHPDCKEVLSENIELIYPKNNTEIFVPKGLNGTLEKVVFEAVHRNHNATIFWHLNDEYIISTKTNHRIEIAPIPGKYQLTLVDEFGENQQCSFEILSN